MTYLFAAEAPGSPADRWGGCAPHRRNSRPQEGGRAAGGLGPLPTEPLFHHSSPAHLLCFLPLPPHGLSVPAEAAHISENKRFIGCLILPTNLHNKGYFPFTVYALI